MAIDQTAISDHLKKPFIGSETVDISTANHTFTAQGVRNAIVTASGNVKVLFLDGTNQTIPVVVASNDYSLLFKDGINAVITMVYMTGTTATVLCGLY